MNGWGASITCRFLLHAGQANKYRLDPILKALVDELKKSMSTEIQPQPIDPFGVTDCALIALATGERAQNLRELLDRLVRTRDDGVIYYPFWGGLLESYAAIVGENMVDQLRQLARPLAGMRVVHVNSTREGGGVAEILHRLIPLKRELGLDVSWEVTTGDASFFQCTKRMHNLLQGDREPIPTGLCDHYEQINARGHKERIEL
jgi:hypothetical protein